MGCLVKISGVVTRRSAVFPQLKICKYNCTNCGYVMGPYTVNGAETKMAGVQCPACQAKGPYTLNTEQTVYCNYQKLTLQESPGSVPAGRPPPQGGRAPVGPNRRRPPRRGDRGDRRVHVQPRQLAQPQVRLPGVLDGGRGELRAEEGGADGGARAQRGRPQRDPQDGKGPAGVHDAPAHLPSLLPSPPLPPPSLSPHSPSLPPSPLPHHHQIQQKIIASIAPSIFGHLDIKTAVALSMFGGCSKNVNGKHRLRGDINVLLLGDPGTAKSQFLKYVEKTSPRAVYTTGQGASAVGPDRLGPQGLGHARVDARGRRARARRQGGVPDRRVRQDERRRPHVDPRGDGAAERSRSRRPGSSPPCRRAAR